MTTTKDKVVRQGVQSVEQGARLLSVVAAAPLPMTLSAAAAAAGMVPSKAHRYLVSLARARLIEQNPVSGRYGIGPAALEIGLAALRRLDVARVGEQVIADLGDVVHETVVMTVWANHGPTIIRWADCARHVSLRVRLGSSVPLLTSSNGRVFLAWLPAVLTSPFIDAELAEVNGAAHRAGLRSPADVEHLAASVRRHGLAHVDGELEPGIAALSAPVFDYNGALAAALTLVGPHGGLDVAYNSVNARALVRAANELSSRLGAPPRPAD